MLKRAFLSLAFAGAFALAACQPAQKTDHKAAAPTAVKTITIATIAYNYEGKTVYNGATQTLIDQGWLADELKKRGIALKFEGVSGAVGGPQINEGFAAKRIDFALYGDFPALIARSGGVDIRDILSTGQGNNAYLVVRKGLNMKSIKDLKGKSIAIHHGRPWELTFQKLLDANGLKVTDFKIYNLNPQAGFSALASGKVDATFTLSEALVQQQKGAGDIIWSTKEAPLSWKMRTGLFARKDFIDANLELTQLVVTAYVKAAQWQSDEANKDQVLQIASRGSLPVDLVAQDYEDPRVPWRDRFSPLIDGFYVEHFKDVAAYTYANKLVQKNIAVDDIIDDRFVAPALKELKLETYWTPQNPVTQ
ncbi:MAG TPA: ABC transporter substrate-binding protein [Asticcacaulis sp.]|nr:ABC transporter substrate-binding protein [Asticcacaulis sp.]